MKLTHNLPDPSGHVHKLIFEDDKTIVETVVYTYEERIVICFSVQCGCPVGCTFCGTGNKFVRNLSADEILQQIYEALDIFNNGSYSKVQLMAMSMGEPMLNWEAVEEVVHTVYSKDGAIRVNTDGVSFFISTVGILDRKNPHVWERIYELGAMYRNFGLQISLHHWSSTKRRKLLGGKDFLLNVDTLHMLGWNWSKRTGRPCYWNYICTGSETEFDAKEVAHIVGTDMHLTCSVVCDTGDFVKGDPTPATRFATMVNKVYPGVSTSVFNPAGQDTIGGGCGQLLYVQEKLKNS